MGTLPLFVEPNSHRDRALGMILGAACGAREGRRLQGPRAIATDWPQAEAVLLHTGRSLLEVGRFDAADLLRRLIKAWAAQAGQPKLLRAVNSERPPAPCTSFIAGLAPIAIIRQTDRKTAQFEALQLARTFNATPAEAEALEVASVFLRRALLGGGRDQALGPMQWEGEDQVAAMAAGRSLPLGAPRDLIAAVDQARTVALQDVSLAAGFTALRAVQASEAAFILSGMLMGGLQGRALFVRDPFAPQDPLSTCAQLERLGDDLLARLHDARAHSYAARRHRP